MHVIDPRNEEEKIVTLDVVYQWMPSRCSVCEVFGHNYEKHTKKINEYLNKPKVANDSWKIKRNGKEVAVVAPSSSKSMHTQQTVVSTQAVGKAVEGTQTPSATP